MVRLTISMALLTLSLAGAARADEAQYRCGTRLVALGDGLTVVRQRCGKPTSEDRRVAERGPGQFVTVDELVYDRGPQEFVRTLRFEDGKLVRIDAGDYGAP